MSLTETPICNFGEKAKKFNLLSTDNKNITLQDIKKNMRLLIIV